MDSPTEDTTMRTLLKRVIAEGNSQSAVNPSTSSKRRISIKKKINNPVQQLPNSVLRSKLRAKVRRSLANSSMKPSTSGESAARKMPISNYFLQEGLEDFTPRGLLKNFIQTEQESSIVKVVKNKRESRSKQRISEMKLPNDSADSFSFNLPEEDTTEQNFPINFNVGKRKRIRISQFEKETLLDRTEAQGNEPVEPSEKTDMSTTTGFLDPDFVESTTKPILSRSHRRHKFISKEDFEKGLNQYLQAKEPEENEQLEPFENTTGLIEASGIIGSFDVEKSVARPVLSRRPGEHRLVSEDYFEEKVLFYLQEEKEKRIHEERQSVDDAAGKEKSAENTRTFSKEDELLGSTELFDLPETKTSDGMEVVESETANPLSKPTAGSQELRNESLLNTEQNLERQTELSGSFEEESVKTANAGRPSSPFVEEKEDYFAEQVQQSVYTTKKDDEDLCIEDQSDANVIEEPAHQFKQVQESVAYSETSKQNEEAADQDENQADYNEQEIQTQEGARECQSEHGVKTSLAAAEHSKRTEAYAEKVAENDSEYPTVFDALEPSQEARQSSPPHSGGEFSAAQSSNRAESDEVDEEEELTGGDSESEQDPSEVRPVFQRLKSKPSPLLTTPHFLKILATKEQKPLAKGKQSGKRQTTRQKKEKPILPRSFIKNAFSHYAKMKVKKETYNAVEQCMDVYFKQLCDDMDVYSKHAKRKTVEKEDLELLMKRQGFVTDKTPLNVLIEQHLPMEYREKLIPMAVSGNNLIPKK
ncbi:centromere protein T isoform X2 [Callorhinchus milii]|uniref:Centromere protein T n=2 Tax=Callorhinchus milii TaxID=7868 RepID=V9KBP6_CALMI|nr:centromere protein T isoform X2 [Callorhinchus milii]XP_042196187.1 centromere protein T isoform X2 [Callorhinchus milii]XP_042196188.1 centromere protein T isoform X2 [Callorhinchus milii]XP_042196189.1 centromere protein T isoform X2 [Callorhinchus milii]XP_042196190.1 centromere protein T isoform X2 [Callorhinchus milii]